MTDGGTYGRFARDMLLVLNAAQAVNPGPSKALQWMRTAPIARFGYMTPVQMIRNGRADDVVRYLRDEDGAEGPAPA